MSDAGGDDYDDQGVPRRAGSLARASHSDKELVFSSNPLIFRETLKQHKNLVAVLENPTRRAKFLEHCSKAFAAELIYAYEAIREYEGYSKVVNPRERMRNAKKIIDEYIAPNSASEVNISHAAKAEILACEQEEHFTPEMFSRVKRELLDLMHENFSRFYSVNQE